MQGSGFWVADRNADDISVQFCLENERLGAARRCPETQAWRRCIPKKRRELS